MSENRDGIFTIQVERGKWSDEINPEDLKLQHQECLGGRLKFKMNFPERVECARCGRSELVEGKDFIASLIRASINGEEATFKWGPDNDRHTVNIVAK